jgi:methionyl-tRNA formyltransferase
VLAFNPYPVAQTRLDGQTLRIWRAWADEESTTALPGTVLREGSAGIVVATGSGVLRLTEVQLPGGSTDAGRSVSGRAPSDRPAAGRGMNVRAVAARALGQVWARAGRWRRRCCPP